MEIKKGIHEYIDEEYEYLLIAQQHGFFQTGFIEDDITSCDDWMVVVWIHELDKKYKINDKMFVEEVLPTFKRWISQPSLRSYSGLGYNYEILKATEELGIKITISTVDMILEMQCNDLSLREMFKKTSSPFVNNMNRFSFESLIENIKKLHELGIPYGDKLGRFYTYLLSLQDQLLGEGKTVSFKTLVLLDTCPQDYTLEQIYDEKATISRDYGYDTCNAMEIEIIYQFMNGINSKRIGQLHDNINRQNNEISKCKVAESKRTPFINQTNKGDTCTVKYFFINNDLKLEVKEYNGIITRVDSDKTYLENSDGERAYLNNSEFYLLNPQENGIISEVTVKTRKVYIRQDNQCAFYKKRMLEIARSKNQIERWQKAGDVLDKYRRKYGTIEGVAYLTNTIDIFLELVDKDKYPIDNLFAACFSQACRLGKGEEALKCAKITYDRLLSAKYPFPYEYHYDYPPSELYPIGTNYDNLNLRAYTYGLDINHFITPVLERIIFNFIADTYTFKMGKEQNLGGERDAKPNSTRHQ